jgi:uncharacterized protein YegJ (DUF2314 family)
MSGWMIGLLVLAAVVVFFWWRGRNAIEIDEGGVSHVRTGDADMARAIAQARQTFHSFVDRLQDPQPGDENFGLKAGIPTGDGDGVEHIWLTDVVVDDTGFEGAIANEPRALPFAMGERWRGRLDQLSDWTYFSHGRMQGNFTARAMMPRLPKAQREQMQRMMESRWDTRELAHTPWPRDAAMPGKPLPDAISTGDSDLMQAANDHTDAHLGKLPSVFHELVSPSAHIDLYPYPATAARPFHVVTPTGMAEQPMQVPPGVDAPALVELVVLLPPTWPLDIASWKKDIGFWPMQWLKRVARFHYESGHWLGEGHVLANGDPAAPIDEAHPYDSVLLAAPRALPEAFRQFTLKDGRAVRYLCLYFLTPAEREAIARDGWEAFASRITPERLSVGAT